MIISRRPKGFRTSRCPTSTNKQSSKHPSIHTSIYTHTHMHNLVIPRRARASTAGGWRKVPGTFRSWRVWVVCRSPMSKAAKPMHMKAANPLRYHCIFPSIGRSCWWSCVCLVISARISGYWRGWPCSSRIRGRRKGMMCICMYDFIQHIWVLGGREQRMWERESDL